MLRTAMRRHHVFRRRCLPSRPVWALAAVFAGLISSMGAARAQAAGDADELVALINRYRSEARACQDQTTTPAGPLAPSATLAVVDASSGEALQRDLTRRGYFAAEVQLVSVTGPTDAREAMRFLAGSYCQAIANPEHAEIGVERQGKRWRIVMARPLLAPDLADPAAAGREMVRLANQARSAPRRCGTRAFEPAAPVRWDPALAEVASVHSRDMATHQLFAHRGSDGSNVAERATHLGYAWRNIGENLATGQGSSESVMAAWLASPHHCENIMNSAFTVMGASYAINPDSDTVIDWTQVFARPRPSAAAEPAAR